MSTAYEHEDYRLALDRQKDRDDETISSGELRKRLVGKD